MFKIVLKSNNFAFGLKPSALGVRAVNYASCPFLTYKILDQEKRA